MIIKCKMCGGDLNIGEGNPICECEFCGTQQTIPQADSEKKANLFNRANRLRMNAEFDKAAAVYASITAEFPEEAEAYWGLCLCKYGIEYVDDPLTGNKIPTCHRTLPESIMDDSDFEQACENADGIARRLYREEAKQIDRLQQDILSIVASEAAYIHSALSKAPANRDYGIQKAYVLSNGNIRQEERTIYLPVYLASSIREQTAIGILPPL